MLIYNAESTKIKFKRGQIFQNSYLYLSNIEIHSHCIFYLIIHSSLFLFNMILLEHLFAPLVEISSLNQFDLSQSSL